MLADPVLPRVSRFENQRSVSSVGMRRRSAVERDIAEDVRAVVADDVVEVAGRRRARCRRVPRTAGCRPRRARRACSTSCRSTNMPPASASAMPTSCQVRPTLGSIAVHAGAHAHVVLVGERDLPHPVDPQRRPARVRLELDDDGARAVGEHPAEEVGVHAGADAVEATLPQAAARQFGADDRRARMVAEPDLAHGRIERGQAGCAHARRGQQLHRSAAETTVHHRREARHEHVAHRRRARQHPHVGRVDPAIVERRAESLDRELLVELGGLAVLVERVVPLPDAVRFEDAAADALGDRDRRRRAAPRSRRCRPDLREGSGRSP